MHQDVKDSQVHSKLLKSRLTSYWHGVPEEIKSAVGIYEDKEVVADDNLITSRWPPDLPAFMREIMNEVKKTRKWLTTQEPQEYLDHKWLVMSRRRKNMGKAKQVKKKKKTK